MADPRGNMTFKCQAAAASEQSSRRAFGNAVGKIGDLQVLNDIGAGKIGKGLRTLSSVSNSLRTGCGSLPTSIGGAIDSGANWILDQVGITSETLSAVNNFNPGVANQAWGQAKQIFQKVKQGNFKFGDVPFYLQDLQNLERLGRNIYTPGNVQGEVSVKCTNSPYAVDLVHRAPKSPFMFVVQFTFNDAYKTLDALDFAFVVKKSSRPGIKFDMDDVNYYNYRTKVMTKVTFEEMSMEFHDDLTNTSLQFYNAYRRAISPITNLSEQTFFAAPTPEQGGMDFSHMDGKSSPLIENSIPAPAYSASRGPLALPSSRSYDTLNVLRSIKLYHIFDGGRLVNTYTFLNPRISEMSLDDLDMSVSDGNNVSIKFNYDTVYVETSVPIEKIATDSDAMPGQRRGVIYPIRNNKTASAMDGAHSKSEQINSAGALGKNECGAGRMNTLGPGNVRV